MKKAGSFLVALLFAGCAAAVVVPLPPDAHIVPPAPAVPRNLAAFSGKWVGAWVTPSQVGGRIQRRDHILIVEEIRGPGAAVVFALGSGLGLGIPDPKPVSLRMNGRFADGALKLFFPNGATVTYRMLPDGTLDATNEHGGAIERAHMIRAND